MVRLAEGKVFMSFKRLLVVATVALAVSGVGQLFAQSQGESAEGPSLGDFARQQKAQREKAAKKPAKEFSNDNLPARPAAGALTVAAAMSAEGEEKKTQETEGTEAAASGQESTGGEVAKTPEAGTSESAPAHDEAYYREAMRKLQDRRAMHQRQLSVLEQKLSQGQMLYYPDPNKTLEQESTPAFHSEINKLRDEVAKKQQDIADDDKAMDDLREQLRREGGPPGWLR
jgi:hypothetical protein